MKKIIVYLFFIFHLSSYCRTIETERTIWYPWTITHSQEWELMEQQDTTISHCRRNEYFESMEELLTRDTNWLMLVNHIHMHLGVNVIFPDLGFAIVRKADQKLIGTIILKISDLEQHLSFGYALIPEVRNDKLGQEIIAQLISYSDNLTGSNIAIFKQDTNKSLFMKAWQEEGKNKNPDFAYLSSFFKKNSESYLGLTASVDAYNPASLAVLIRSGMEPYEISCTKYIVNEETTFFSFSLILQYPTKTLPINPLFEKIIPDLLSRNAKQIQYTENFIKSLFAVSKDWSYLLTSRNEKAALKVQEKITSTISLLSLVPTKSIRQESWLSPYCFID